MENCLASVPKRAVKVCSTVRCSAWKRIIPRCALATTFAWRPTERRSVRDPNAAATKCRAPTSGRRATGPTVRIRAVRASSTGGWLVIASTSTTGSTRSPSRSDVTTPSGRPIFNPATLVNAMPSTSGNRLHGNR
jgi:hypothetical protein